MDAARTMKLVIGNRRYSSWSLRGWLACRQSGLPFDCAVVPLFGPDWHQVRATLPLIAPSAGKVPVLWHGDTVVWDSLGILDYLADQVGRDRFWPRDAAAAGLARSVVAEMHGGFAPLRSALPFNLGRHQAPVAMDAAVIADIDRVLTLWSNPNEIVLTPFMGVGSEVWAAVCAVPAFVFVTFAYFCISAAGSTGATGANCMMVPLIRCLRRRPGP